MIDSPSGGSGMWKDDGGRLTATCTACTVLVPSIRFPVANVTQNRRRLAAAPAASLAILRNSCRFYGGVRRKAASHVFAPSQRVASLSGRLHSWIQARQTRRTHLVLPARAPGQHATPAGVFGRRSANPVMRLFRTLPVLGLDPVAVALLVPPA